METIGERISALRVSLNLKQKELADLAGVTEATLSRYENNKREPRGIIIAKIADALNVSSDYLLTGNKKRKDPSIEELDKHFSQKEKFDFAKEMEIIKQRLIASDSPLYNDEPMDEGDMDRILSALEFIEKHSAIGAKKFAPKKYRK